MIGTVSLNPAVDVCYEVTKLNLASVTRINRVHKTAGGKGLNVSRVATQLGENVKATGFLGGYTGEFIKKEINKLGISDTFVNIEGETRTCLAILSKGIDQTELLEPGPTISKERLEEFLSTYESLLKECEVVVASGSLPKGVEAAFYKELILKATHSGVKFLLDTSGESLRYAIEAQPYFIKPNIDELMELTGVTIHSERQIIESLRFLHNKGIKLVIVSRGKEGCMACFEGHIYKVTLPEINAINPVGSGDSFVAGAAVALQRNFGIEDLLVYASACGTANAMEAATGFVNLEVVRKIKQKVRIKIVEKCY